LGQTLNNTYRKHVWGKLKVTLFTWNEYVKWNFSYLLHFNSPNLQQESVCLNVFTTFLLAFKSSTVLIWTIIIKNIKQICILDFASFCCFCHVMLWGFTCSSDNMKFSYFELHRTRKKRRQTFSLLLPFLVCLHFVKKNSGNELKSSSGSLQFPWGKYWQHLTFNLLMVFASISSSSTPTVFFCEG
jgi:hypothetical protein